jgi:hypothetical protein
MTKYGKVEKRRWSVKKFTDSVKNAIKRAGGRIKGIDPAKFKEAHKGKLTVASAAAQMMAANGVTARAVTKRSPVKKKKVASKKKKARKAAKEAANEAST